MTRDDRGDFMQVRFWSYLQKKCIDACRAAFRQTEDTERLETGYTVEGESEGLSELHREVDRRLSTEELATISEALGQLPPRLRRVYLLRHYVGMKIGSDGPVEAEGNELTIAAEFGCYRANDSQLAEASGQATGRVPGEARWKIGIESTLGDALNTFVQENDRPTAENVQEWVDRYPQFRKDLVEFAAAWAEQLVLPAAEEIGAEAEKGPSRPRDEPRS